MRATDEHPVKTFVEQLRATSTSHSLDQEFTEQEILQEIASDTMHGFCLVDVEIPHHRRIE